MDMGGAPSSLTDKNSTRIDTSKNCKVQAVAFDFALLTSAIEEAGHGKGTRQTPSHQSPSETDEKLGHVKPDTNMVNQIANLLNINLGGKDSKKESTKDDDDDLSLLLGHDRKDETTSKDNKSTEKKSQTKSDLFSNDIRSKYADKLQKKGMGGITGVDIAKQQVEETMQRGDAGGHLAARKIAMAEGTSAKKWLALSGTGQVLRYLTQRSMKIILLPQPVKEINPQEGTQMEDLSKQLNDVVFDVLVKDGSLGVAATIGTILKKVQPMDPNLLLVVSDRDDYLKSAKEAGMTTCRIRPPNARRGNISTNYMASSIPEVKNVVDEINTESRSTLFSRERETTQQRATRWTSVL
eukprot:CAMPEP_0168790276 /NCGR_PEP_ID=MMETSP0725-20121227/13312_1 /TAXON_ID=265536 /ORGANISM="Amphiprora sp., Strain CCMP467" /LENGTH=352 /DNA_ID=CAMNT_0008840667 /DNA_START=726 /DNA_END=1784 /DNA_ORIENTATION=-